MDKKNVFKLLEEESEINFKLYDDTIHSGIKKQKKFWFLMGDILELYMSKFISSVLGRNISNQNEKNGTSKTID